jgi:hypothetical protein
MSSTRRFERLGITWVPAGSDTSMPSTSTRTYCCGAPRSAKPETVPGGPLWLTVTPGRSASWSCRNGRPSASSVSPVSTETAEPVASAAVGARLADTTMSGSTMVWAPAGAASASGRTASE